GNADHLGLVLIHNPIGPFCLLPDHDATKFLDEQRGGVQTSMAMNILLTGGAGFIGRWVTKRLLDDGHSLWIIDDLSNGSEANLAEFRDHPGLKRFVKGS